MECIWGIPVILPVVLCITPRAACHELDDTQEINYRPIMQAIAETDFTGYVGHEFITTRDPLQGLTEAVALCKV